MPGKEEIMANLARATLEGDDALAKQAAQDAITANLDISQAINDGLAKGMKVLGDKYEKFECFLPELMLGADAMEAGLAILRPKLLEKVGAKGLKGKVVIGTAFGDIHDIGKNLVSTFMSVAGFEVIDLGKDIPPRDYVKKAQEVDADIIAISCLVSPSMYYQRDIIDLLNAMGIREKYYVIVGGGPITIDWTKQIGSDGYGKYAEDGVKLCEELIASGKKPGSGEPLIIGL